MLTALQVTAFPGADEWDGETFVLAAAVMAPDGVNVVPTVTQLLGRNDRRRAVTIINNSPTASIRVCRRRDQAERPGRGVTVPPGGGVPISSRAEFYVASDSTTAQAQVTYVEEVDA